VRASFERGYDTKLPRIEIISAGAVEDEQPEAIKDQNRADQPTDFSTRSPFPTICSSRVVLGDLSRFLELFSQDEDPKVYASSSPPKKHRGYTYSLASPILLPLFLPIYHAYTVLSPVGLAAPRKTTPQQIKGARCSRSECLTRAILAIH
jgi:hypothetical protein